MTSAAPLLEALAQKSILLSRGPSGLQFRAPAGAIDPQLREQLTRNKDALLEALARTAGFVGLCPVSSNQHSLLLSDLMDAGSTAYHLILSLRFRGEVDAERLHVAVCAVVNRHAQLRTTYGYVQIDDRLEPCQFVHQELPPSFLHIELPHADDAEVAKRGRDFYEAPLSLEAGPIVQVQLLSRSSTDHVLLLKLPHIATDGWSMRLVSRHLAESYRRGASTSEAPTPRADSEYTHFTLQQLADLRAPAAEPHLAYWRSHLSTASPPLAVADPARRPAQRRASGATLHFELDAEQRKRIDDAAKAMGISHFSVLLASFQELLLARSHTNEVVVGIPTLGARGERFDATVGYFVNPIAVRCVRSGAQSFESHARSTAAELSAALEHRDVPFTVVVDRLGAKRDPSRTPVFQAMFNLLNRRILGDVIDWIYPPPTTGDRTPLNFAGIEAEPFPIDQQEGQFDLTLELVDRPHGYHGLFKYCTDLFTKDEAEQLLADYRSRLTAAVARPAEHVFEVQQPQPASTAETSTVVVSATFTAEPIAEGLSFWFQRLGWKDRRVAFAPFNQVFQSLLDPGSDLRKLQHGYGVLLLRSDDLLGQVCGSIPFDSAEALRTAASALRKNLEDVAQAIEDSAATRQVGLVVVCCEPSPRVRAGVPDEAQLRAAFEARVSAVRGVSVLSVEQLARWYPVTDGYEPLGEEFGQIPYTPAYFAALASGVARVLQAQEARPVKALVVDCDGTLWDGVVGEDGATGVKMGPAQHAFHDFLLAQSKAGVVLCLCSKNQEADVWDVLDNHPDSKVRREHFPFFRINWQRKSQNLHELAAEINIGIDTLAFLDDNPLEREEVRFGSPEVLCLELPEAWEQRVPYLAQVWPLDHLRVTAEDQKRTEHYRVERQRDTVRRSTSSWDDFLEQLGLVVDIRDAAPSDFDRIAQLSVRTNQFNTTLRRMSLPEVEHFVASPGHIAVVVSVSDRFGDYGLVGVALAHAAEARLSVDLLMMSCRALGRGVEHRIARALAERALAMSCRSVAFPCITTERNEPARAFLASIARACDTAPGADGVLAFDAAVLAALKPMQSASVPAAEGEGSKKAQAAASTQARVDDTAWLDIARSLSSAAAIEAAISAWAAPRASVTVARRSASGGDPSSDTEQLIAKAWRKVLRSEDVGTGDNFFDLGGTSILMAQVAVELRKAGLAVTLVQLFQCPTIATLAAQLDAKAKPSVTTERRPQPASSPQAAWRSSAFERARKFRTAKDPGDNTNT